MQPARPSRLKSGCRAALKGYASASAACAAYDVAHGHGRIRAPRRSRLIEELSSRPLMLPSPAS